MRPTGIQAVSRCRQTKSSPHLTMLDGPPKEDFCRDTDKSHPRESVYGLESVSVEGGPKLVSSQSQWNIDLTGVQFISLIITKIFIEHH